MKLPEAVSGLSLRNSVPRCHNAACAQVRGLKYLLSARPTGVQLQGRWYCSFDCFEQGVANLLRNIVIPSPVRSQNRHRFPLGLLLLGRGVITERQLREALRAQREAGTERLGYWLLQTGSVSSDDLAVALAAQWGYPLFPLDRDQRFKMCSGMLPLTLIENLRMIPVHYISHARLLYLAFSEEVDRPSLLAIEQTLGDRTEVCVVSDAALDRALNEIRRDVRPSEIVFDALRDAYEMANAIRSHCVKFGVDQMRIARPGRFLWARLFASGQYWDLLFPLSAQVR